jgi:hypothetical protein
MAAFSMRNASGVPSPRMSQAGRSTKRKMILFLEFVANVSIEFL